MENSSSSLCDSQWINLYTTAAYLPEEFSPEDHRLARNFYLNFQDQCRDGKVAGLIDKKKSQILRFDSRRELLLSLCTLENCLRHEEGLPLRQCRYNKLMQRWRYPDGYL